MAEGMKLSVVMPAQNEEGSVAKTVEGVAAALEREGVDYEVIVVNDDSEDGTEAAVAAIGERNPRVRVHRSHNERGFGNAIRAGLDVLAGLYAARTEVGTKFDEIREKEGLGAALRWRASQFAE